MDKYGIKKGDKVAFSMRNYPEWMFCYMAITSIGGVVVPLNSWWKGDEIEYGLTNSEAKLFIGDEERLDRLEGRLTDLPKIAVRSSKAEYQDIDFYQLIKDQSETLDNPIEIDVFGPDSQMVYEATLALTDFIDKQVPGARNCLLYTSPSPRD